MIGLQGCQVFVTKMRENLVKKIKDQREKQKIKGICRQIEIKMHDSGAKSVRLDSTGPTNRWCSGLQYYLGILFRLGIRDA